MPRPLTIQLSDGTSIDIDQDEWHNRSSAPKASLVTLTSERLVVIKHDDGRTLVYAVIERPGDRIVYGELLPPESTDIKGAVMRVARALAD